MKVTIKLAFLAAALAAVGCAEHTQPDPEFPADNAIRSPRRFAEVQRANGARNDGNLYEVHFTDDAVNSLGRAKLESMISDDETVRPVTIHMIALKDMSVTVRRMESVTAYLKDAGLTDAQIKFETGLKPGNYHPAAPELANLQKMETGAAAEPPAAVNEGVSPGTNSMNRGSSLQQ